MSAERIFVPLQDGHKPSAYVSNRMTSQATLTTKSIVSLNGQTDFVDSNLCPPPRRIPFFILVRTITCTSTQINLLMVLLTVKYTFVITISCLIQSTVHCLEYLVFAPIILWGLIFIASSWWKVPLLRSGIAVIPDCKSVESGTTVECCGQYSLIRSLFFGRYSTGAGMIAYGGWNIKYGRFRDEPVAISKLEHIDLEGAVHHFVHASLPYQNSYLLYNPSNDKQYVHIRDLPYELIPDKITGHWTIKYKRIKGHVALVIISIVFWLVWIACIVWMAFYIKKGQIFFPGSLPTCPN